jgi:hypothetical protein
MKQLRNSNPYGSRHEARRPLKELLHEWGRNGWTSSRIPWLLGDDDDDDDDDETSINLCCIHVRQIIIIKERNKLNCPPPAYRRLAKAPQLHTPASRGDGNLLVLWETLWSTYKYMTGGPHRWSAYTWWRREGNRMLVVQLYLAT